MLFRFPNWKNWRRGSTGCFLDRIATHILAWEGTDENPGNWYWFEGNFDDYQKNRVERLGEEAARPHRIHRKLTRD